MTTRAVAPPTAARARVSTRAAVLVILAVTVLTFAITPLRALLAQRDDLDRLQRQTESLQRENDALHERILHLQDPAYLERLARECLGMVAPGETALVLPGPNRADC